MSMLVVGTEVGRVASRSLKTHIQYAAQVALDIMLFVLLWSQRDFCNAKLLLDLLLDLFGHFCCPDLGDVEVIAEHPGESFGRYQFFCGGRSKGQRGATNSEYESTEWRRGKGRGEVND